MTRVYLDYAASTPLDRTVAREMHRTEKYFSNTSSLYRSGREANEVLQTSLKKIGMFFGAKSEEIIITSGTTESNNLAILGTARLRSGGEIISVKSEHSSVREPIKQLRSEGYKIRWCKLDKHGRVELSELKKLLNKKTILISIAYANGEIGTIQPMGKIAKMVRDFEINNETKVVLHTDISAAIGTLNCDVNRLGADLVTCGASKIYGPKGVGIIYIKRNTPIKNMFYGGFQQSAMRPGTEDLVSIVGFAESLQILNTRRSTDARKYQQYYIDCIHNITGIEYLENGHPKDRIYSVLSLCFDNISGENIVAYLDAEGFEIATGAACEASNDKPSEALIAIGRTLSQAQGSVRISFGRRTSQTDVNRFIKIFNKVLKELY
ncbi:MAG: cysteine desulfurase family protein [Candidatus Saccharibacteria bacterium]